MFDMQLVHKLCIFRHHDSKSMQKILIITRTKSIAGDLFWLPQKIGDREVF